MVPRATRLVLFDIDGTLLWSDGAGREAIRLALRQVVGQAGPTNDHRMAGKTDRQIINELLQAIGLDDDAIQANLPAVSTALAHILPRTLAAAHVRACPGVPALLQAVDAHPQLLLGLLTGNLSTTAPIKLRAAGLEPTMFKLGAFGSDHADRLQLPAIAADRARELTGQTFTGLNVVIIGDTPADVACAHGWGAKAIAVATGPYDEAELRNTGAEAIFADLSATGAVIEALLNL